MENKEKPTITVKVDEEVRSYNIEDLSEEANRAVAAQQFYQQTIQPLLGELVRLIQVGAEVERTNLTSYLPETYKVIEQKEVKDKEES
jgi:hypothetical protein